MDIFFCWCSKHMRFELGSVFINERTAEYLTAHPEVAEAVFGR